MRQLRIPFERAALVMILAGAFASSAGAQATPPEEFGTPDGLTPAMEEVCDMTTGKANGLCVAFCEAMDCDSDDPHASPQACTRIRDNYLRITGEAPPCLRVCPCWTADDLDVVTADNQLPFNSCETGFFGIPVIQTDGSEGPTVEGGFAVDPDGFLFGAPTCLTRDLPPFTLVITPEEGEVCAQQIFTRCEEIGTPIGGGGPTS